MEKITRADIRGPRLYAAARQDLRRQIIELKKRRRVSVGDCVTLVFENRATVIFQIEEMCRAEGLDAPDKIQEEIEVYNRLLPDAGELAATLMIEITDEADVEHVLERLVGLQEHVWLVVGGTRVKASFDGEQFEADRLAAVQYLRFPLGRAAEAALREPGTAVALAIDHPNYRHEARLDEATRAELARDLD
jgi:hypothetical protein